VAGFGTVATVTRPSDDEAARIVPRSGIEEKGATAQPMGRAPADGVPPGVGVDEPGSGPPDHRSTASGDADGPRVTASVRTQLQPDVSSEAIREALLSLEGTRIEDLRFPLPGDLKDIAKASGLVSGIVEDRIPALLNSVRTTTWDEEGELGDYEFRKLAIGFPDILLVKRSDPDVVLFEIEAKSWYILSRDALTARFLTSQTIIRPGTLVVVVAWMLDSVVSGSPVLLRMHVDDALRFATVRDKRWTQILPAGSHRVVEPENARLGHRAIFLGRRPAANCSTMPRDGRVTRTTSASSTDSMTSNWRHFVTPFWN
jgi:hypothetical protein